MKIDFRTKLFLTIIIGISATEGSISMNYKYLGILLAIFPYLLAILDKKWSLIGKGLFYTGIAVVGQIVASKYPNSYLGMVFNLYCGIILRILPGVMRGSNTKVFIMAYFQHLQLLFFQKLVTSWQQN